MGIRRQSTIYFGSVAEVERISQRIGCHLYYSGYEANNVELEGWKADQGSTIMVATAALGTGISIDCVLLIIHIYPYNSATDFIQESGRAGRRPEEIVRPISLISERDHVRNKQKASGSEDVEKRALAMFAVTEGPTTF